MVYPCVLFTVSALPSASDDYYDEHAHNIGGLAEWFNHVPALFLMLIGGNAQPTPFAAYTDPGTDKALACTTESARKRWDTFYALAKSAAPQLQATLAPIDALLQSVQHSYLALDIWSSVPEKDQGKRAWKNYVERLLKHATQLESELAQCDSRNVAPSITKLFDGAPSELGYWSAAVVERSGVIDRMPIADIPALSEYFEDNYWLSGIPAYIVRRESGDDVDMPIGVVTPYRRWLVPFEAGMTHVEDKYGSQTAISQGWLCCSRFVKTGKGRSNDFTVHSALFDVNGIQVAPLMENTHFSVLSAQVGSRSKVGRDDKVDVVNLPDMSVILEGVQSAHRGDDGYIRYSITKRIFYDGENQDREFVGLIDEDGRVLIPADRYAGIRNFHKSKKITIVSIPNPQYVHDETRNRYDGHFEGVIDSNGKELIPCQYERILPVHRDSPPKVYQKDRLIAIGVDRRVHIYKTNGELVAATPYTVPGQLHYVGNMVPDDDIMVSDGEFVWLMSFEGKLTTQLMSLQEFMDEMVRPLRDMVERAKTRKYREVSARELEAQAPWQSLRELCTCLCLGDSDAGAKMADDIAASLRSDEAQEEGWSVAEDVNVLSMLVQSAFMDAADSGYAARIDWKDSDSLGALGNLVQIPALQGFRWDPNDNGDSMSEGIEAARKYALKRGVALFLMPSDGDMYEIGFARAEDREKLAGLAASMGVDLQFD